MLRNDPATTAGVGRGGGMEEFEKTLAAGFAGLTCPVLLVRGGDSMLLEPETVEAMRAVQPAMAYAEVPGVGHPPSLDEPEAVRAMESFWG